MGSKKVLIRNSCSEMFESREKHFDIRFARIDCASRSQATSEDEDTVIETEIEKTKQGE